MVELIVPADNVSDSTILISDIRVVDGEFVSGNTVIAILESSKSTFDLISTSEGFFFKNPKFKDTIGVGEVFGIISKEQLPAYPSLEINRNSDCSSKFSKKAERLILENNLSKELFSKLDIVRESDVTQYLESAATLKPITSRTNNKIVIWGAGGFGKMCVDLIKSCGTHQIMGFVDDGVAKGSNVYNYPVLGDRTVLGDLLSEGITSICIAVASLGDLNLRMEIIKYASDLGFLFPNIIHKTSLIESTATLGEGNLLFPMTYVGSDACIASHCIINVGSQVSHDCVIQNGVNLTPGCILAGSVHVGSHSLIGMGSTVYLGVTIDKGTRINNGSHIFRDV